MKDYRLTIKVRNNRILRAIEAVGGIPGGKWCEANGLTYTVINQFINMTLSPLAKNGAMYPDAARLCDVLGKLPEELWSNEQLYPLERNFSEMEMDHAEVIALLPPEHQSYLPDFSNLEQEQTRKLIADALSKLPKRQRQIIQLRYTEELTFEECGNRLGISKERVRQLEAIALRKLRRPAMVGIFVDALDGVSDEERAEQKAVAKAAAHVATVK